MIAFLRTANRRALAGVVLLRLDFNTEDDWRLCASLPTVRFLLRCASRVIIVGHKGRPAGADKKFSLQPEAARLSELLRRKVRFIPHFNFAEIKKEIRVAPWGSVFLLENLRFLPGETKNDSRLARKLVSLADFYVNDAFAVSHRANASIAAITKFLPAFGGLELEQEVKSLSHIMENPKRPLIFILGGGKASDKLGILKYFKRRADYFLLGGVAANTMLLLKGVDVGASAVEKDRAKLKKLRTALGYRNLILPADFARGQGGAILDIGKKTALFYSKIAARAGTIIWSGPLGLTEKRQFAKSSIAVARAVARNRHAFSLAGGGETVAFLKKYKLDKKFSFISTGGGAMLEFLEGKQLPGIKALERK